MLFRLLHRGNLKSVEACLNRYVQLTQQISPLQSAIKRLSQGRYYSSRTEEVLGKAEAALDEFVGAAMNISNDNAERNVSKQGEELSLKVRKSSRYIERGQVNQSAYNSALSDSIPLLEQAVAGSSRQTTRAELSRSLEELRALSANSELESRIDSVDHALGRDATARLEVVENDGEGRDVSAHGRPLWNIFENSMTSLHGGRDLATREGDTLDSLITRLESTRES